MDFFSKNPKLSLEKMLVFGALGLYVFKYVQLKKQGQLSGEPDMLLKIDKRKMFDIAGKRFKLSEAQRNVLEGVYDHMVGNQNEIEEDV